MDIRVAGCRHEWPERAGFHLDRPKGLDYYIFIHFKTPVTYTLDSVEYRLSPGACVICPPNTPSVIHSEGQLIHDWMHLTGEVARLLSSYSLECKRIYYVRDSAYISRLVRSLEREFYSSIPYKNDPSITEMARAVHLSESRFHTLYKQIFGISPKNDLIIARIERAKYLLEQNKYNNAQIAAMTGYTNEYHFIRQFKKIEGITPKEYARAKSRTPG